VSNITFSLPIYWTKVFKTKPNKTHLAGINWYRNAFHTDQNNFKQEFTELVLNQVGTSDALHKSFSMHYDLYYKSVACDPSNVIAMIEKVSLDALKHAGYIKDDNVRHHLSSSYNVIERDKENPRVIVTFIPKDLNEKPTEETK